LIELSSEIGFDWICCWRLEFSEELDSKPG
jgi:hypothetical protein